jgi:hypothetical protein
VDAVRNAVHEWASANGVIIRCEVEAGVLTVRGCFTAYALELRRM